MSYKNNKSANAYDMSDYKSRLQLRNEDLFDLIVEDDSDLNEGPYIGSIIAYEINNDSGKVVATIRIPKLHDYQIPINKCNDETNNVRRYSSAQDKMLAFSHITAVSTFFSSDLGEKETEPNSLTNIEVLVYFRGSSPKQGGKTRNAEFDLLPVKGNTINRKGRGCYETGGGMDLADGQVSGFFAGDINFSMMGNVLAASEHNPPFNSRVSDPDRSLFTCKDIDQSAFKNQKGQDMYSKTPVTKGKKGWEFSGPTNPLIDAFLTVLTNNLDFSIKLSSTFRTKKRQGELVTGKTFDDTVNWSGIKVYGKSRLKKFIKFYKDCNGDRKCVERKQIAYWESQPAKGHGLGIACDISTRTTLTAGQVKQILCLTDKMGINTIMEVTPPHMHVQIVNAKSITGENPTNPMPQAEIQALVTKWESMLQLKKESPYTPTPPPGYFDNTVATASGDDE